MIEYSVEGGTRRERELVERAFCFALQQLMPRKRNLEVNFTLRNMEENSDGWHLYLGGGEHEIDIQRGLSEEDLVTAVFHEMVHLRQYERNQLTDNGFTKGWVEKNISTSGLLSKSTKHFLGKRKHTDFKKFYLKIL